MPQLRHTKPAGAAGALAPEQTAMPAARKEMARTDKSARRRAGVVILRAALRIDLINSTAGQARKAVVLSGLWDFEPVSFRDCKLQ